MKILRLIKHHLFWQAVILLIIDLIFFGSINTTKVAQIILIVGFGLLILNCYLFTYLILSFMRFYGIPIKRKSQLSIYVAIVLGVLIALQSIGELSPKDVAVVLPLAIVGYIYLVYSKASRQKIN